MNGDRRVLTPSEAAPCTTAQLSSVERSRLLDLIVADIGTLTAQVNWLKSHAAAVNSANDAIVAQLREHRAMLDAHSGIVLRPSLWVRLRRVLGC